MKERDKDISDIRKERERAVSLLEFFCTATRHDGRASVQEKRTAAINFIDKLLADKHEV